MTATDLSAWLSTEDAATAIGCSTRTLERRALDWHIEKRLRPQAGSPAVAVYNPADVARVAAERRQAPPPHVLPAVSTGNGNGRATQLVSGTSQLGSHALALPPGDDPIRQFFALMIQAIQSPPHSPPVTPMAERGRGPAYVSRAEARAIAGISDQELRTAVIAGEIRQRGRRYRRVDVEGL